MLHWSNTMQLIEEPKYTAPKEGKGGGGGLLYKVLYREGPPRGPILYQLLYSIFDRKGTPY